MQFTNTMSQFQMQQMLNNPQQMHNMMMNDNQYMSQMVEPMMNTMMGSSQMRHQMIDMMLSHQGMMSSMKQNKSMMGNMTGMMNENMMMGDNMMKSGMISGSMMKDNQMEVNTIMKQQNKNQIGMMLQDPQLKQQMRNLIIQNIDMANQENKISVSGESSDKSVSVQIVSSTPMPGKFLEIIETFHDNNGNILEHVNHGIHVTQDEQTVLKMSELHSHQGEVAYYTRELHSSSPVKIEILMNGIGMESPLTGPIDEVITVKVS